MKIDDSELPFIENLSFIKAFIKNMDLEKFEIIELPIDKKFNYDLVNLLLQNYLNPFNYSDHKDYYIKMIEFARFYEDEYLLKKLIYFLDKEQLNDIIYGNYGFNENDREFLYYYTDPKNIPSRLLQKEYFLETLFRVQQLDDINHPYYSAVYKDIPKYIRCLERFRNKWVEKNKIFEVKTTTLKNFINFTKEVHDRLKYSVSPFFLLYDDFPDEDSLLETRVWICYEPFFDEALTPRNVYAYECMYTSRNIETKITFRCGNLSGHKFINNDDYDFKFPPFYDLIISCLCMVDNVGVDVEIYAAIDDEPSYDNSSESRRRNGYNPGVLIYDDGLEFSEYGRFRIVQGEDFEVRWNQDPIYFQLVKRQNQLFVMYLNDSFGFRLDHNNGKFLFWEESDTPPALKDMTPAENKFFLDYKSNYMFINKPNSIVRNNKGYNFIVGEDFNVSSIFHDSNKVIRFLRKNKIVYYCDFYYNHALIIDRRNKLQVLFHNKYIDPIVLDNGDLMYVIENPFVYRLLYVFKPDGSLVSQDWTEVETKFRRLITWFDNENEDLKSIQSWTANELIYEEIYSAPMKIDQYTVKFRAIAGIRSENRTERRMYNPLYPLPEGYDYYNIDDSDDGGN